MHRPKPISAALAVALIATLSMGSLPSAPAMAKAPMVSTSAPGYFRLMVGKYEVTALSDGTDDLPVDQLLTNTTPAKVQAALAASFLKSPLETSVNAYLINTGDRLILIDTGAGTFFGPTVGKLQASLKAAGYRPEQIDDILITHMHPDHVGGLIKDGKAAFPNAIVHINKADVDFWLSPSNREQAPAGAKVFFQDAAASIAPYIASHRLATFDGTAELVPGIKSVPIAGHTAGHTGYLIQSDGQTLFMWGDVVHVAAIQFADPSVAIQYDGDQAEAEGNRAAVFAEAAKSGELIASSHIAFPGLGHVRAKGDAFEWVPVNYSLIR